MLLAAVISAPYARQLLLPLLRYGALPIVRRTGGLADTVRDIDRPGETGKAGNGFVFDGMDHHDMRAALERACRVYKERPDQW